MPASDVTSALGELERKLQDLEQELRAAGEPAPHEAPAIAPTRSATVAAAAAPAEPQPPFPVRPPPTSARAARGAGVRAAAPPPPPPPPIAPDPRRAVELAPPLPTGDAAAQLAELGRFRDELEQATQALLARYDELLTRLGRPPRVPQRRAGDPGRVAALTPVARPPALEEVVLDGRLTVDAGPFADIATLSAFEQALERVPGVEDVSIRGFDGDRALIDLLVVHPLAFGLELRDASPVAFSLTRVQDGAVSLTIAARD